MRVIALFLLVTGISTVWLRAGPRQNGSDNSQASCQIVRQALEETRRIKGGMTRREVEKYFTQDGGLQTREETRYLYRRCDYIKVDIEFKPSASVDRVVYSPDDIVIQVSRPYLDNPNAD
jgi:hypothetical protein